MTDKIKRKNHFQIRKVPLRKFIPEKTPELYALDVHSICLPNKNKKIINWASINYEISKNYEQDFNQQIMYSQTYQQLYSKYSLMKEERQKEKLNIQNQVNVIDASIQREQIQKKRLLQIRDDLYTQIQHLRQDLTQCRDRNYNYRWEVYHRRGAYYANANGFSLFEGQATYQELLQLEQQIGNVPKGLTQIELALLPKKVYQQEFNPQAMEGNIQVQKQICCICYDDINKGEYVTILKCSHVHHCQCIKDWLAKQKICPICKKQVTVDTPFKKNEQSKNSQNNSQDYLQPMLT